LNAFWIAVDLDYNGNPLMESPVEFQVVEHAFIVVFTAEMLLRFMAFEQKWDAFLDRWFVFDAILVLIMIVESWVLLAVVLITDSSTMGGLGVFSTLRMLRLLRLGRLTRLVALLPELRTMLAGMLAGIRSVLITAIILLSMTYIFAIILRQMGSSTSWGKDHFHSVPGSVYTLLVESMLPDNGELLGSIGRESWFCAVVYFVFLLLSAITVMNMLIGILCEVVGQVSTEEKERQQLEMMSKKLQAVLRSIDKNYDGLVSRPEFESMIGNMEARQALMDVGVDIQALIEDADFVFSQKGPQMTFEDFREEVLTFRSTLPAVTRTIMHMRRALLARELDVRDRILAFDDKLGGWRRRSGAQSASSDTPGDCLPPLQDGSWDSSTSFHL